MPRPSVVDDQLFATPRHVAASVGGKRRTPVQRAETADTSLFDLGFLGQLGAVPGWPGAEAYPPQPMKTQVRAVLDAYQANGGSYREVVLVDCGHSPHVEKQDEVVGLFVDFVEAL